jgi:phosphoglycerol transferase
VKNDNRPLSPPNTDQDRPATTNLKSWFSSLLPYVFVAILSTVLGMLIWHFDRNGLTVPIGTGSDQNFAQTSVANFIRAGHIYVNPLLGAPGQQELYDYPMPHWLHFGVLAVIKLFTSNPAVAINLWFLVGYPLTALTAVYALRRLSMPTGLALAGSVIYAFIPFHHLRNEAHLVYSEYFMVPLLALVTIWIATGHVLWRLGRKDASVSGPLITRDGIFAIVCCILIGWDTPYNAFFGACLLATAALVRWLRRNDPRTLLTAASLIAVLSISLMLGLAPNMTYVRAHGRIGVATRAPAESEIYGLTLIQMFSPVQGHRIARLARWKEQFRSQAVLVNENETAALGIVGTLGCIALFFCLLWRRCPDVVFSLSILNLVAFLIGTIGGLGAIFSFLISPQLRGVNRISVFISFYCIAGFVSLLDIWLRRRGDQPYSLQSLVVLPVFLLVVGVYDQVPRGLMAGHDQVERQYHNDAEFVRRIESLVPPNSMIFELPFDPFPETPPIHQMSDYDEVRGYLHSTTLRWSYGAMKGRPTSNWLAAVSSEPVDQMLLTIVGAGFGGLYIDRYGYPDSAAALESHVASLLGSQPIVSEGGRLSFFPLDGKAVMSLNQQVPPERRADLENALHPILADPGQGCWDKEGSDADNWRWCGRHARIDVVNAYTSERRIVLDATFATGYPADSTLTIEGSGIQQKLTINSTGTHWQAVLTVPPGEQAIKLSSDANQVLAPGDPRDMFFRINNFRIHEPSR